ncbi:MAG: hypothetical protein ACLU6O_09630 [Bilophila wadsworthia]
MSRMSRRAFSGSGSPRRMLDAGRAGGGSRNVPAPEFSPAMLRAEAERLGLDPDR